MVLATFGKEFIIINEELAIYISFLIVLTILISNFGKQVAAQFADRANQIANNYSQGSKETVKLLLINLTVHYKTINYINHLVKFEASNSYKLLNLKDSIVKAILAAEYKFA